MKRTEKSKEIETYETKNADLESGRPRNYIFDRPSFAKWNFIYATFKPLRGRELHELHRSSDNNVSSLRRLDVADPISTGVVVWCECVGGDVQFDRVKRARRTQVSITQLHCIHIASFF